MNDLAELIRYHHHLHPGLQPLDVYKLLYQGLFGPEHLLADPNAAKKYLEKEWLSVDADKKEELLEPVSLDESLVRVNLRPFKFRQLDINSLWTAFVNSAKMQRPEKIEIAKLWTKFEKFCQQENLEFDYNNVVKFGKEMENKNYPPAHHSLLYREKNWPAYRVVRKKEILPYLSGSF